MKNGYYIFAYIEINKFANYYKTDTKRHDQNLSLWKYNNGNLSLVRYWELERLSRIKHHNKAFSSEDQFKNLLKSLLPYEHWICQVHYRYQSGYGKKGYKKDTNVKQNRIRHEKHLIKWIYGFELHFSDSSRCMEENRGQVIPILQSLYLFLVCFGLVHAYKKLRYIQIQENQEDDKIKQNFFRSHDFVGVYMRTCMQR